MYSKYLFAIEENNEDWIVAKAKPGSSQDVKAAGKGKPEWFFFLLFIFPFFSFWREDGQHSEAANAVRTDQAVAPVSARHLYVALLHSRSPGLTLEF